MAKQIYYPRLTRRDCERLLDVHQQLNRAKDALEHANWPGGRPVAALLLSALILISELYNRAESTFLAGVGNRERASPENGQADPPAAPAEVIDAEVTTVVHKEG